MARIWCISRKDWTEEVMKARNYVAKHAPEFCKPKVYKNRKKEEKAGRFKRERPKHEPYVRSRRVYGVEDDE